MVSHTNNRQYSQGTAGPLPPPAAPSPPYNTSIDTASTTNNAGTLAAQNLLTTTMPGTFYLTPATHHHMLSQSLALEANPSALITYEARKAQACGIIAAVGAKVGLPQRSIDTAFVLWQRRSLHGGAPSGTAGQQVALASLFLACKINDTAKKARDLVLASYPLRYPELIKTTAIAPASSSSARLRELALTHVHESDIDASLLDAERAKILSLERSFLDCVGYDFRIRQNVEAVARGVLKLGRAWGVTKMFIQNAWSVASDVHRTSSPLLYQPITLSLAALLTAALMCPTSASAAYEASAKRIKKIFGLADESSASDDDLDLELLSPKGGMLARGETAIQLSDEYDRLKAAAKTWAKDFQWEEELRTYSEEVEDVVHLVLDLYSASINLIASQQQHAKSHQQQQHLQSAVSSPASPLNTASISPASPSEYALAGNSKGPSSNGTILRLPPYVAHPPPAAIISWLRAHASARRPPTTTTGSTAFGSLGNDLTMAKIRLRRKEDARRNEETVTAGGSGGVTAADSSNGRGDELPPSRKRLRRRLERRREIDQEKARVQILRVQVVEKSASKAQKAQERSHSVEADLINHGTTVFVSASAAAAVGTRDTKAGNAQTRADGDRWESKAEVKDSVPPSLSLSLKLLNAGLPIIDESRSPSDGARGEDTVDRRPLADSLSQKIVGGSTSEMDITSRSSDSTPLTKSLGGGAPQLPLPPQTTTAKTQTAATTRFLF